MTASASLSNRNTFPSPHTLFILTLTVYLFLDQVRHCFQGIFVAVEMLMLFFFLVNDNTAKISNSKIRKFSTTKTKSMHSTSSQPVCQNIPLILSLIFLTDFLGVIFQANSTLYQFGHKTKCETPCH